MTKFFEAKDISAIDRKAAEYEGIKTFDLMRRAARRVADYILARVYLDTKVEIFAGTGNNGGDAILAGLYLRQSGCVVRVWQVEDDKCEPRYSEDCLKALKEASEKASDMLVIKVRSVDALPVFAPGTWVVDGLFGSGLTRPLSGVYADVVGYINRLRNVRVVSIDLPSGLQAEDNRLTKPEKVVRSTEILVVEYPKLALLLPENEIFIREWTLLPIGIAEEVSEEHPSPYRYLTAEDISPLVKEIPRFAHKGTMGHALIVGGRRGKTGAVVLAAKAALRAGAGLVTAGVPRCSVDILQTALPEAMVRVDEEGERSLVTPWRADDLARYDAIGVGIGMGVDDRAADVLHSLLRNGRCPMVIDADALNILAQHRTWMDDVPQGSLLTPHPGEFDRLLGHVCDTGYERLTAARKLAVEHGVTLILKGHYTAICTPDGTVYFNPTGGPAMATAGCGDTLTGILTGLLAQGFSPTRAARVGVWAHGVAADRVAAVRGERAVIASDIIDALGIDRPERQDETAEL